MEKLIIWVERNNSKKDTDVIQDFVSIFNQTQIPIMFYESPTKTVSDLFLNKSFKNKWTKRFYKYIWGLCHIKFWIYIALKNSISYKVRHLTKTLQTTIPKDKKIILVGRSIGAIVATKTALNYPIYKVICTGYPFKSPKKRKEEPYRTTHLKDIPVPTLILQGINDEYGGKEILSTYTYAPSVSIAFFNTDHDFKLSALDKEKLQKTIDAFLKSPL